MVDEDELACLLVFTYHSDCEPTVQQADMIKQAIHDYAKLNNLTLIKSPYRYIEDGGEHALLFSLTVGLERLKPRYHTPCHNNGHKTAIIEAKQRLKMPRRF
jgi:hypothetical protein